jgi:hypothetical protein
MHSLEPALLFASQSNAPNLSFNIASIGRLHRDLAGTWNSEDDHPSPPRLGFSMIHVVPKDWPKNTLRGVWNIHLDAWFLAVNKV